MFSVKKLDKLMVAGIISADQKEQILNFEKDKNSGFVGKLLTMLGIFTVGIGIISLVAANWDQISHSVKLATMFMLLIGTGVMAFYWQNKGQIQKSETALVLLFLLIGAAIGLIIQIYQLSGGRWFSVIGLWCSLGFPLLFVAQKNYMAHFWTPLFLIWCAAKIDEICHPKGYDFIDLEEITPLISMAIFAFFALFAKTVLSKMKFSFSQVIKKDSSIAMYICLIGYIIMSWGWDDIYRLVIATGILIVLSFVYKYAKAYNLIRWNIKLGGLIVLVFYFDIADEIGLFKSGIGMVLSGLGLILLVKYLPKLTSLVMGEKKNA